MNKWKKYYEELLTENRQEYATISPTEINISGEVINIDIPQTKNNRAPGPENIPAKDDKDIKKRISQARRTIGCLNGVFWSNEAGKKRKINIYQTLVKSSLLYGAETWRITEANRKKLEAVEMDAYRRTLGISRRDRVRNEEIQERIGIEGSLATDIERQQLMWYGDVQRMDDTRLPKQIMQWIPQHRRKRGRPKKTWKEGVTRAMSA
ncbi:uncharacterized protein LOC115884375 [Sitophilus oryzae]|uniref:Uncharacterized protein LOC115884375 n=1 Tax=Sitophilus oryzae TaxID=7048 RepID=A0A6J2Y6U8_SITOR|nr:uncharacterized protein LOC115884375 [Sitophilus oryzae]